MLERAGTSMTSLSSKAKALLRGHDELTPPPIPGNAANLSP